MVTDTRDVLRPLARVALPVALVSTGLLAGLFFAWDVSVMPGLARLDDRGFTAALQAMDVAIRNPVFLGVFLLAPVSTGVVALTVRGAGRSWAGGALALLVVMIVVTSVVHLPLNAAVAALDPGDAGSALAAVRAEVEGPWRGANVVRTLACALALLGLGRATARSGP